MPADPVRDAAIDVLLRVFERGAYLNLALDTSLRRRKLTERGRRFLTQLVYGTVRHRQLCDHILAPRLHQPLVSLPAPILNILRMGVFQALFCGNVTFPAMVHTSVDLAKKRGHAGTARLTNAVLKRVPQRLEDVALPNAATDPVGFLSCRYSLPAWLAQRWVDELGFARAEARCAACNEPAPATLRVNTQRIGRDALADAFARAGVHAEKRTPIPEELTLLDGPPPARSKRFHEGQYFLQDPASMLAPHLLEPAPGDRVLDLCAAPGGKSTHLAQLMGHGHVVAADVQPAKLRLVRENADRLGLPGLHLLGADGRQPPFRPGHFQRVLVDAPCSGLGTLRRHPDLKWRIAPDDIARLAQTQQELLRSAWELCENGGVIVYSVCTLTPEETTGAIACLAGSGRVTPEDGPPWLDTWKSGTGQYQTNPENEGLDGFFLMRLRKQS